MENTAAKAAENGVEPSSSCSVVAVDSLFSRKIQFQLSTKHYDGYRKSGDFPIETLNPDPSRKRVSVGSELPRKVDRSDFVENGLDPEFTLGVTFKRIGAGLENLGNTCFLNSVVQCLTYTEPLAAYLQSGKHQNSCHIAGFCALCAIQKHVSRALQSTGRSLVPKDLVSNLRCISRNFRNARQEDAHEYMVNLLESMHKCCLPSGVPSDSTAAYEKSLVHKIFGGRLRSQVECQQCHYCSNTFDPFLDLSLHIFRADTLHVALRNFTAAEMLDGGEKGYRCERCKQKVKAKKRLTVHKAPYVLSIHLKRFDPYDHGRKVDKKVVFDQTLDMKPFVSGSYEGELKYSLYGVLVHYGHNTHSGHYVCFVRTSSGMWYLLNDNQVHQVSEKHVLEQKAYMLFYVRDRKHTVLRRTVDVAQKENIKALVSNNMANAEAKQLSNGHLNNGSIVNRLSIPCSSAAVNDKDAANAGCIKERPLKETKLLQNDQLLMPVCFVPKLESTSDASLNVPFLKDPVKVQTLPSQGRGEGLSPSAPPNSKNDGTKLNNISNMKGTKTSDSNELSAICDDQNSAVVSNVSSQNVDPVRLGPPPEVSCKDFSDRAAGKVQSQDLSLVSDDKVLVPRTPVNSSNTTGCDSCQVRGVHKDTVSGNLPCNEIDDGCQEKDLTSSSTSSILPNDCQQKVPDCKRHKKLKYKLMKNWLFRASLGILKKKKKKYRKCKGPGLETQNLIKQQLLENYCLPTELAPSTSNKTLRNCPLNLQSKNAKSGSTNGESWRSSSKDPLMDVVNGEFKERSNKKVSVLAMNEQIKKSSAGTAEEKQQGACEFQCFENSERDALQIGATSMFTRCMEESTVPRWDGIEPLPSHSSGMRHEENVSIGYVPDEWDEEYDRGKRKKVRQDKQSFGGPNPFQEIATRKTQFKKAKMDRSISGNQPFRI